MFDAVHTQHNCFSSGDVVFHQIVGQVSGGGQSMLFRLIYNDFGFARGGLFDFDATYSGTGPVVHLLSDFIVCDVIGPGNTVILRNFDIIFTAKTAKVGTR